jgi:tRNA-specific 2-thiouridylase
VIVGPREALLASGARLTQVNWLGDPQPLGEECAGGLAVLAKVRSTRPPKPASLSTRCGEPWVAFDAAEEAVAPGQACVLYDAASPSRVLGGGFISGDRPAIVADPPL